MATYSSIYKDFINYLKHPTDAIAEDVSFKSIVRAVILTLTVVVGLLALVVLVYGVLLIFSPDWVHEDLFQKTGKPMWIVCLLGPFLEECTFRLALRRNKARMAVCFALLPFMVVSKYFFAQDIYTVEFLLPRIGIGLLMGVLLLATLSKPMSKCRFSTVFYISALLFGLVHVGNVSTLELLPFDYLVVIVYVFKQFVMGLLLGYIRIKNGFVVGVFIHAMNNSLYLLSLLG